MYKLFVKQKNRKNKLPFVTFASKYIFISVKLAERMNIYEPKDEVRFYISIDEENGLMKFERTSDYEHSYEMAYYITNQREENYTNISRRINIQHKYLPKDLLQDRYNINESDISEFGFEFRYKKV